MSSAPKKSPPASDAAAATAPSGASPPEAGDQSILRNRYLTYFAIVLLGCGADLATKHYTFAWLGLPGHFVDRADPANLVRWQGDVDQADPHLWWLIPNRLGIQTSVNRGALFGMGEGYWWVFACLSLVAIIGILTWLFVYRAARDRWLNVALASITGGILGNLYDRLGLWDSTGLRAEFSHGVRDWILFVWPEIKLKIFDPWPNFNIADSLLVTGAIMLVVHAIVWREKEEQGTGNRG